MRYSNSNKTVSCAGEQHQAFGETPIVAAPSIDLPNGQQAIPQQFFRYVRTRENLENILSRIQFDEHYVLFVGETRGTLYLQVGVIGFENYPSTTQQPSHKIVYGRMWLIEANTPTSEVVQTALLAIKKAREHELREKLFVFINEGRNRSTPFNSHMDLPLMASHPGLFEQPQEHWPIDDAAHAVSTFLNSLKLNTLSIALQHIEQRPNGQWLIDLQLTPGSIAESLFADMSEQSLTLLCQHNHFSELLHRLMDALIAISDAYVDEHFQFDHFARFSRHIDPRDIARFSLATRLHGCDNPDFKHAFRELSCEVDSGRAPRLAQGKLGTQQRASLGSVPQLDGFLPSS